MEQLLTQYESETIGLTWDERYETSPVCSPNTPFRKD
jgi:hypothetical protein